MVVVMAIIGILLGIAIPSMTSWTVPSRVQAEADRFRIFLQRARNTAVNRGERITVCKSNNQSSCDTSLNWGAGWLMFTDTDSDGAKDGGETIIRVGEGLPQNYTLRSNSPFADWIAFIPSGESRGSGGNNGSFRVCGPNGDINIARDVIVNMAGRVRAEAGSGSCPSP
jgi:type IV fimbrial biogenesis protein FimT